MVGGSGSLTGNSESNSYFLPGVRTYGGDSIQRLHCRSIRRLNTWVIKNAMQPSYPHFLENSNIVPISELRVRGVERDTYIKRRVKKETKKRREWREAIQ